MNSHEREFVLQIKENQRIIHKMCKVYTNNVEDHEDLFQEIIIQLWNAYPKFRGDAKFSTWMYRIALNTAMSAIKKQNRKEIPVDYSSDISTVLQQNEEYIDDSDQLKSIYDAIHQMSETDKALIMMFLDNTPYQEIGEILNITEGNARVRMNRAKNTLKQLIRR